MLCFCRVSSHLPPSVTAMAPTCAECARVTMGTWAAGASAGRTRPSRQGKWTTPPAGRPTPQRFVMARAAATVASASAMRGKTLTRQV